MANHKSCTSGQPGTCWWCHSVFRCPLCWRTSWAACWLETRSSAPAPLICWSTRSCCRLPHHAAWCRWWSNTANACRSAEHLRHTWVSPNDLWNPQSTQAMLSSVSQLLREVCSQSCASSSPSQVCEAGNWQSCCSLNTVRTWTLTSSCMFILHL